MRFSRIVVLALPAAASILAPGPARADEPDTTLALVAGAATNLVGMMVGSTVIATGNGGNGVVNAGWLTICGSFTLSPIVAHGVVGEWGRGLLFAGVPAAMTGGTVALFQIEPGTVNHGTLGQQRIMWGFVGAAFLASAAGIVDATLAAKRARPLTIAPVVGTGRVGVEIGGAL